MEDIPEDHGELGKLVQFSLVTRQSDWLMANLDGEQGGEEAAAPPLLLLLLGPPSPPLPPHPGPPVPASGTSAQTRSDDGHYGGVRQAYFYLGKRF